MRICYCAKVTEWWSHGEIDGWIDDRTKHSNCQTNMDWYSNGPIFLWPIGKSHGMQEIIRDYSPYKIQRKGCVTAQIQDKTINSSAWSGSRRMFWHCEICRSSHKPDTTIFKSVQSKSETDTTSNNGCILDFLVVQSAPLFQ